MEAHAFVATLDQVALLNDDYMICIRHFDLIMMISSFVLCMSLVLACRAVETLGFAPMPHVAHYGMSSTTTTALNYGDARGDYYGESCGSFMVKEFSLYQDLQEIVSLASKGLPERPDGIVCVVKYTSSLRPECQSTEADYERLARANPATIFLRCFEEYENANLIVGQAQVQTWPTYDFFYQGNRVARLESGSILELEELLQMYQFQNSNLDLFSEEADNQRRLSWGNGSLQDATKTPRTTNRFLPGYDWNTDKGFFDELGDTFQDEWDKIYGNWTPDIMDDDQ